VCNLQRSLAVQKISDRRSDAPNDSVQVPHHALIRMQAMQ